MANNRRFLGVYVDVISVQSEGLNPVFDNLSAVGANAIVITPRVGRPAEGAGKGVRFPDLHIDGYDRVVARPVWGCHELQVEFFLPYTPNPDRYADSPYKPAAWPVPPDVDANVPQQMIAEAHRRGMQAHLQLKPFSPPGLRDADQQVYVDGTRPRPPVVARTACLNNPAAQAHARAIVSDTTHHFPEIDGLFLDWAEYGAYGLKEHFACFCEHCKAQALADGFDWDAVRRDVGTLLRWLQALTPAELDRSRRMLRHPGELLELAVQYPGWIAFWRFKAQTVLRAYAGIRHLLEAEGHGRIGISARGWPPPWNRSSGMDYRGLASVCSTITPKLFTFDYSVLPRWYGQTLLEWNPGLSESAVLDALVEWMDLPDDIEHRSFAHYQIPAPDEPHPARLESYRIRVQEVLAQVNGRAPVRPFVHPYLPEPQWKRMVALMRDTAIDGLWVHKYAYLSDRKLQILNELWR